MDLERGSLENLLVEEGDFNNYKIYIWGTGNTTMLYQEGLQRLEQEGIFITGYIDNDSTKWGKTINEKMIFNPKDVSPNKDVLVLISTPQPDIIKTISEQLDELGIRWKHIDDFILKAHRDEVLKCYDLLGDEKSKKVYKELIECRLNGRYPKEDIVDSEQYFSLSNFMSEDTNEVFVDLGAYVGDTIERYIWKKDGVFKRIIAFEPDEKNLKAMNFRIERLKKEWNIEDNKIVVYPYGNSDSNTIQYVEQYEANNGLGSKIVTRANKNTKECKLVSIDGFIEEEITFLKADIESYEYKMLLGAKESIRKWKPKMAISIYHNAVDFYAILLLVHEINPDYHFAIRHYTHVLSETVLYVYNE